MKSKFAPSGNTSMNNPLTKNDFQEFDREAGAPSQSFSLYSCLLWLSCIYNAICAYVCSVTFDKSETIANYAYIAAFAMSLVKLVAYGLGIRAKSQKWITVQRILVRFYQIFAFQGLITFLFAVFYILYLFVRSIIDPSNAAWAGAIGLLVLFYLLLAVLYGIIDCFVPFRIYANSKEFLNYIETTRTSYP